MRDGKIVLEDGTVLVSRMLEADFLRTPAGRQAVVRSKHGIYCLYALPGVFTLAARTFAINAQFKSGRLDNVSMTHDTREDNFINYDEAEERANADADVVWVRSTFGAAPRCTFFWGYVWAGFVPQNGFSGVIIRYAPGVDMP